MARIPKNILDNLDGEDPNADFTIFGDDDEVEKPKKKKKKPSLTPQNDADQGDEEFEDDDQDDDLDEDDLDEGDEADEDADEDDGDDGEGEDEEEEGEDEDGEEETPKRKPAKTTSKRKLTPVEDDDDDTEDRILKRLEAIFAKQNSAQSNADGNGEQDQSRTQRKEAEMSAIERAEAALRKEREEFTKLRKKTLDSEFKRGLGRMNLNTDFQTITGSREWNQFLKSSVHGVTMESLFKRAYQESSVDDMLGIVNAFAKEHDLIDEAEEAPKKTRKRKAVPAKTKAQPAATSKKRVPKKKYEFHEDDFTKMTDNLLRGRITRKEFDEFESKYDKAEKDGRVQTD